MASSPDNISMALFCDFENVALGVRDANYDKFDIKRVLERLLLKGSIVVKKAYCDWDRYKGFKAAMHEANFELIEIPHVRQSGKNSADIRLVVDALDLCYTKSHVNTFVIISGDSDFSPLVSKLRENAKYVIGVGVKQSTSDLLIANCDEFIFYDDLVRESQRQDARRSTRDNREPQQVRRTPEEEARRREELDARRTKAVEMAAETYEALVTDRDEGGRIWASVLKEAIKRRNPGFNENYYGFRTFGTLLEEAKARGLLEFGRDEKSSAFVFRGTGFPATRQETRVPLDSTPGDAPTEAGNEATPTAQAESQPRRDNREGREGRESREGRDGRQARDGRTPRAGRGRGGRSADRPNTQGVDLDTPRTQAQQAAARKAYGYDDANDGHASNAVPEAAPRKPDVDQGSVRTEGQARPMVSQAQSPADQAVTDTKTARGGNRGGRKSPAGPASKRAKQGDGAVGAAKPNKAPDAAPTEVSKAKAAKAAPAEAITASAPEKAPAAKKTAKASSTRAPRKPAAKKAATE